MAPRAKICLLIQTLIRYWLKNWRKQNKKDIFIIMLVKYFLTSQLFCISVKMELTWYLESSHITKVHSIPRVFIAPTKIRWNSFCKSVFVNDKCPTTTLHFSTATANVSNSFSASNQSLRKCWVPFHHISIITFYMGIQFVIFE